MFGLFENLFEIDFNSQPSDETTKKTGKSSIEMEDFLKWAHRYETVYRCIKYMCRQLGKAQLIRRFDNKFTFKIPNEKDGLKELNIQLDEVMDLDKGA